MSNPKIELYTQMLNAAKTQTLKVATDVPEDNRSLQLAPGKATPLWLVGHIAFAANTIILQWTLKQESLIPAEHGTLFAPAQAGGTPITNNPDDYPSWDEVVKLYTDVMDKVIEDVAKLEDAVLPNAIDTKLPPPFNEMFTSIGACIMIEIFHDSHHRGQIAMLAGQ